MQPPAPRSFPARVVECASASPDAVSLVVAVEEDWIFTPGQVVKLAAGPGTAGYFAIASAPSEASRRLAFLVKAGGSDSEPLMRLEPGAAITITGPFGLGFELPPPGPGARLLLVTAGTALSAVRSAVVEAIAMGHDARVISVLVGVRDARDLVFADELEHWHARGATVRVAVSHGDLVPSALPLVRGRVQAHLADLVTPATTAFIAGSETFEDEVSDALVAAGLAPERIQRNYRPDGRAPGA